MKIRIIILFSLLLTLSTSVYAEKKTWQKHKEKQLEQISDVEKSATLYISVLDEILDLDKQQEKAIKRLYHEYLKEKKIILTSNKGILVERELIKNNYNTYKDAEKKIFTETQLFLLNNQTSKMPVNQPL